VYVKARRAGYDGTVSLPRPQRPRATPAHGVPAVPIVSEANQRERHSPVVALLLALVVLPPLGVFAWSCYEPVVLMLPGRWLWFGHTSEEHQSGNWRIGHGGMDVWIKLPGTPKTEWFAIRTWTR
jgi:hypothetical protein